MVLHRPSEPAAETGEVKNWHWTLVRLTRLIKGEVPGLDMSDNPTSMIGLCQEGKSSLDALRKNADANSF
jgi:hypothetical protein